MRMASKLLTSMRFKLRRAPGTSAIRVAYAGYRISRCRKGSHRRSAGANLSTAFVKAASVQAQAAIIPLVGTRLKAGVVALPMAADDARIRAALRSIFDAAVASADPRKV